MKKDVSIILPSIRPHFLETFCASVQTACKKHTYEIVIPTPFDVPDDVKRMPNIKVIKTHTCPTVAKQLAIQLCNGEFLYNITDDGFLLENVIDEAIELHRSTLGPKDVINMIYVEGKHVLEMNTLTPIELNPVPYDPELWRARFWPDLQQPGIKDPWRISLHFFMKLDYFYELGGFDCRWEYSNHAIHDMIFRVQADGGKVIDFEKVAAVFTHYSGHLVDHGPVHDATLGPDTVLFNQIYKDPDAATKRKIQNYSNWKDQPDVWERRFYKYPIPITGKEYETYKVRTEAPEDMAPMPGTPEYLQWFQKLEQKMLVNNK